MPPYPPDGLSILTIGVASAGAAHDERAGTRTMPHRSTSTESPGRALRARAVATAIRPSPHLLLGGASTKRSARTTGSSTASLTASGKPLLANDPHLGTHVPRIWYLAHTSRRRLRRDRRDAARHAGGRARTQPLHRLGRNQRRRRRPGSLSRTLDASRPVSPSSAAQQEPMTVIPEIDRGEGRRVRSPRTCASPGTVRSSPTRSTPTTRRRRHRRRRRRSSRSHSGGRRSTTTTRRLPRYMRLNEARNWNEFTAALRDFVVPSQNFVYRRRRRPHRLLRARHVPIRASRRRLAADRRAGPATRSGPAGFRSTTCRTSTIRRPTSSSRPTTGRLARSAHPTDRARVPESVPRAAHCRPAARDRRIEEASRPTTSRRIQADTVSLHARALLPLLLAHVQPDDLARPPRRRHPARRGTTMRAATCAAPAIFEAWFLQLAPCDRRRRTGAGERQRMKGGSPPSRGSSRRTLDGNPLWCDNVTTTAKESCDEAVTTALHAAVDGSCRSAWAANPIAGDGTPFTRGLPAPGVRIGAASCVRSSAGGAERRRLEHGRRRSGRRRRRPSNSVPSPATGGIVDLSAANDSRFIESVGPSGNFLSKYYDAFQQDWKDVRYRKMRMDRLEIETGAIGRLRLSSTHSLIANR